jgi:glycosyltransferase involved in cell wall biosynthesis
MNNIYLPLVSICIPCYNAAGYIGETLRSALAQTYPNIEIIVCDDQSKDATVGIVRQFNDPRITLHINEKNLGHSGNYNKSLLSANGKYAKLLCADDLITPDCIEKQVRAFEDHPDDNIVMITGAKWVINDKGRELFKQKFPGNGVLDGKKAISMSVRRGRNLFGEPGLPLILVSAFRKTPGVIKENIYCNDLDLWCKILRLGNLVVVNEPLFMFRLATTSISSTVAWKQIKIVQKYFSLLHKDKSFGVSTMTYCIGWIMAGLMGFARNMVIVFLR